MGCGASKKTASHTSVAQPLHITVAPPKHPPSDAPSQSAPSTTEPLQGDSSHISSAASQTKDAQPETVEHPFLSIVDEPAIKLDWSVVESGNDEAAGASYRGKDFEKHKVDGILPENVKKLQTLHQHGTRNVLKLAQNFIDIVQSQEHFKMKWAAKRISRHWRQYKRTKSLQQLQTSQKKRKLVTIRGLDKQHPAVIAWNEMLHTSSGSVIPGLDDNSLLVLLPEDFDDNDSNHAHTHTHIPQKLLSHSDSQSTQHQHTATAITSPSLFDEHVDLHCIERETSPFAFPVSNENSEKFARQFLEVPYIVNRLDAIAKDASDVIAFPEWVSTHCKASVSIIFGQQSKLSEESSSNKDKDVTLARQVLQQFLFGRPLSSNSISNVSGSSSSSSNSLAEAPSSDTTQQDALPSSPSRPPVVPLPTVLWCHSIQRAAQNFVFELNVQSFQKVEPNELIAVDSYGELKCKFSSGAVLVLPKKFPKEGEIAWYWTEETV